MSDLTKYLLWQRKSNTLKKYLFLVKHYVIAVRAKLKLKKKCSESNKADIVILLRHKDSFDYSPIKQWIKNDYKIKVVVEPTAKAILAKSDLIQPSEACDKALFIYAAYAKYFIEFYKPKVILTENNGSVISSFIKREAELVGAKTLHLAHSIPTENYRKFSFIDYHFYLVYGQSSIDNLKHRDRLYGQCKCVITGSWLLENRLKVDSTSPSISIHEHSYLLLGSGPDLETLAETESIYRQVIEYSNEHKINLYFKPHPRSNLELWKKLIAKLPSDKFHIIDKISLDMDKFELAFCGFTNAILDVSKMGIIPVMLTAGQHRDMFKYEDYLGKSVSDRLPLATKIKEIQESREVYQTRTKNFGEYHLGAIESPSKYIAEIVNDLVEGKEPIKVTDLP